MSTRKWSLLGLHRPEYVPSPEVIVSDLAWNSLDHRTRSYNDCVTESSSRDTKGKPVGLAFLLSGKSRNRKILIDVSLDNQKNAQLQLSNSFSPYYANEGDARLVAEAVINSLKSSRPEKSNSTPASPILLETSLLQDLRGAMGKANPPAISLIIARMFNLGGLSSSEALAPWWIILQSDENRNFVEELIAHSCRNVLLPNIVQEKLASISSQPAIIGENKNDEWISETGNTPFDWLANLWMNLNTEEWVAALPRRRWIDWSICLLRTGMSFGYLWEARLHHRVAKLLLADELEIDETTLDQLTDNRIALLDWSDAKGVASRDVASTLKQALRKGLVSMEALENLHSTLRDSDDSNDAFLQSKGNFLEWLTVAKERLRDDKHSRSSFIKLLEGEKPGGLSNLHESVKYSLQSRENLDEISDLYSLLRGIGKRYSVVEPGQEWLVTTASLLSKPGEKCHLDDYVDSLQMLGLRPSLSTIIKGLEIAGLTKSTSDVDGALEIRAAF